MTTLGSFFSEEDRKKFAEANIIPGTVLKCFVRNTNPPKEKRFVVLGNVSDEQFKVIIDFIKQSPKITPKLRKKYGIV